MIKKRISSRAVIPLNKTGAFPVGTKFTLNNKPWVVNKEITEASTQMREIICLDDGLKEIMALLTLERDAQDPRSGMRITKVGTGKVSDPEDFEVKKPEEPKKA